MTKTTDATPTTETTSSSVPTKAKPTKAKATKAKATKAKATKAKATKAKATKAKPTKAKPTKAKTTKTTRKTVKVTTAAKLIARPATVVGAAEWREKIAVEAYLRAESRGFTPGYEIEDWLWAESLFHGQ